MRALDLMSSWVSHLGERISLRHVEGHGLNEAELFANPMLHHFFVQDLNKDQQLQFEDESFDVVLCSLSVKYLQQPEKVCKEVYRVLAAGGITIVTFSRHCFEEKAIYGWLRRSPQQRMELVVQILRSAGFTDVTCRCPPPRPDLSSEPLTDPFWAVIARKVPGAREEEGDGENRSFALSSLDDAGELGGSVGAAGALPVSERVLERWVAAYGEMQSEARGLGIPARAIPQLEEPVTVEGLRAARDLLKAIIESRLSSNL